MQKLDHQSWRTGDAPVIGASKVGFDRWSTVSDLAEACKGLLAGVLFNFFPSFSVSYKG